MGLTRTLGADLRSLRKSRGLTLESLSTQLGRSVGWLSQVERDISTLDPGEIDAIAKLLDVPTSLFSHSNTRAEEAGRVVRSNARRVLGERVPGLAETLLSPDLTDSFEVIHSTFAPGSKSDGAVNRDTAELGYVLSVTLDVTLGDENFTIHTGDSFRVRDETLRWSNPYDAPAVLVWVISPPVY